MNTTNVKQTRINLYTNILVVLANVLVAIYYTPYLVKSLGLAAYGVLPLALIINQYISVATNTLTNSFTRFYSIAVQKGDYTEASKDISTSFAVVVVISLLVTMIGLSIAFYADKIFHIPVNLHISARFLFIYTILSFIVSLFSSLLNVTLYALNRLDILNYMRLFRGIVKLPATVMLFEFLQPDVSYVGLANFLIEAIIFLASIFLFFKFKPAAVRVSVRYFDKTALTLILAMSGWTLIHLCGDTLLYRTDNLIVNHFWGSETSGALGAICEIGTYVVVITNVIGTLFGPLILIAYAKGNHREVKSLFVENSTIVGCISSVLTGAIAGLSGTLLAIWLGKGMEQYGVWLVIKMVILPFNAAGSIMAFVYRAWNRVKFPAMATILLGTVDVAIAILLCEITNYRYVEIVLVVNAIFIILQGFFLEVMVVSKIYPDCKRKLMQVLVKILLSFVVTYGCSKIAVSYISVNNLLQLALLLGAVYLLMLGLVFFVVLSRNERLKFVSLIKS